MDSIIASINLHFEKTKRWYILVCYTLNTKVPISSSFDSAIENKATYLNINQWKRSDKKSLFGVLNISILGI